MKNNYIKIKSNYIEPELDIIKIDYNTSIAMSGAAGNEEMSGWSG
ncbi:MAG: hypothetical protein WC907_02615 [Acholeplasmataceae bacterium]